MNYIIKPEYTQLMARSLKCSNMYAATQNTIVPMCDYNLTTIDLQVLSSLASNKSEALNMITIAHRLGISKSTFSKSITKMVKLGLVEKEQRDGNKKNIYVHLTVQGEDFYKEALQRNETYIVEFIEILDADPLRLSYFNEFLDLTEKFLSQKIDNDK